MKNQLEGLKKEVKIEFINQLHSEGYITLAHKMAKEEGGEILEAYYNYAFKIDPIELSALGEEIRRLAKEA